MSLAPILMMRVIRRHFTLYTGGHQIRLQPRPRGKARNTGPAGEQSQRPASSEEGDRKMGG